MKRSGMDIQTEDTTWVLSESESGEECRENWLLKGSFPREELLGEIMAVCE
jgi:hypothetical protein